MRHEVPHSLTWVLWGASVEIGAALLTQEKLLFNLWHQFRNEQLTRSQLIQAVKPIQAEFSSILLEAAELHIDPQEKTPLAKTVRTCRNLLKLEVALWLFVSEDGVEPTNNAAERAIRPAVIWRRTSFGSDSLAGSEFVSRLLTVVSSLNLQERNILDFLAESILAARSGQIPSHHSSHKLHHRCTHGVLTVVPPMQSILLE